MENKKIIVIGCHSGAGIGHAQSIEIALASLEEKHNCKVEVVNLVDLEKKELKALATELVSMRNIEVRQRLDLEIISCHSELVDAGQSLRNYNKHNSQQGWKNRPKHKR